MLISVVVPAYNEADSVEELHAEIVAALEGRSFEILFVDDGSSDATWARIAALKARDPRVRALRFVRNFGKSAAYSAAFAAARGDVVVTLDADLQDDPRELPRVLARLEEGADLVVGWKVGRFDNEPLKALPSKVFNGMVTLLFGLRLTDSNSGFRAMRRGVAQSLELYGDLYRFIPELAHSKGFVVCELGVTHRKRKHGRSKYGPRRFWTGLLDLLTTRFITGFAERPLHFFGTVGLVPVVVGVGLELYVLANKLAGDTFLNHVAAIIAGVTLIGLGFQSVMTGLVGEMLTAQHQRRSYLIASEARDADGGWSQGS